MQLQRLTCPIAHFGHIQHFDIIALGCLQQLHDLQQNQINAAQPRQLIESGQGACR